MIARRAAEYTSIRYFAREYPELPHLKEMTVHQLKELYQKELMAEGKCRGFWKVHD